MVDDRTTANAERSCDKSSPHRNLPRITWISGPLSQLGAVAAGKRGCRPLMAFGATINSGPPAPRLPCLSRCPNLRASRQPRPQSRPSRPRTPRRGGPDMRPSPGRPDTRGHRPRAAEAQPVAAPIQREHADSAFAVPWPPRRLEHRSCNVTIAPCAHRAWPQFRPRGQACSPAERRRAPRCPRWEKMR